MRPCSGCKRFEPDAAFTYHPYTTNQGKRSTRRDSRCKECRRTARMQRYRANPRRDNKAAQAWREKNLGHVRDYAQAYRKARPEMKREAEARRRQAKAPCTCCARSDIQALYRRACELRLEVDHRVPLFKGGRHCLTNLQLLTPDAHKEKTRADARG